MADLSLGERVARIEGVLEERVLTGIERMESKLDDALEAMKEKGSRQSVAEAHAEIDKIQIALENKADKTELNAVRITLAKWAGIGAACAVLVSWWGPKLVALVAGK